VLILIANSRFDQIVILLFRYFGCLNFFLYQEEGSHGTSEEDGNAEAKNKTEPETGPKSSSPDKDQKEDDKVGEEEEGDDEEEEGDLTNGEPGRKTAGANEGLPRGLVTWREAVRGAQNAAQLAMAFYILETSVAWDKSIMKASCQVGENFFRDNIPLTPSCS
jgi:hypothetical protein